MTGIPVTAEVAVAARAEEIAQRLTAIDPALVPGTFRRLGLLYELGCTICDATDVDQVARTVVDALVRLVPLERCFVALLDQGRLHALATHRIELGDDCEQWSVSRTMLRRVMEEHVQLLSSDAAREPSFADVSSVVANSLKSVLAVPLGPKDNCLGLVYCDHRGTTGSFSQLDLLFVTALSHYIYLGIRNAREFARAHHELESAEARYQNLQAELLRRHQIVGSSRPLLNVYQRIKLLAPTDLPVLLSGETGTGKDLLALSLHAESERRACPFVAVNLAAVNDALVDSELFGHEKGAFTGATERRIGRLEQANGGTLFLDEVADIPEYFQPKLLRALERGEFHRVGGSELVRVHFRLVCATCRDLKQLVREGKFREDLFFRVVGDEIVVPPLRERGDDVAMLADHLLKELPGRKRFSSAAIQRLQSFRWPGNVRQLRSVVHALHATAPADVIEAEDVDAKLSVPLATQSEFPALQFRIEAVEREHIQRALEISHGNRAQACRILGIAKQTLLNKIRQYDLA